jgi:hypothetical protein
MLEQARARSGEAGVELELHEGDMHDRALDEPMALIYCPFRALLQLPTWADRPRMFERVAELLTPAGALPGTPSRSAPDRRECRRQAPGRTRSAHDPLLGWRQPDRHHARRRWDELAVVGAPPKNEWLGLIDIAYLYLELEALQRRLRRRAVHRREPLTRVRHAPLSLARAASGGSRIATRPRWFPPFQRG